MWRFVLVAVCVSVALGCDCGPSYPGRSALRPPLYAGEVYPRESDKLAGELEGYLAGVEVAPGPVRALVAPHGSYYYSGAVAGKVYGAVRGKAYRRVVLLGVNHRALLPGIALLAEGGFNTPLGPLSNDEEAVSRLERVAPFVRRAVDYDAEHSVEFHLPFIKLLFPEAKLVTALTARLSDESIPAAGRALRSVLDEDTLLVLSTNLSHFGESYDFTPFPSGLSRDRLMSSLRELEKGGVDALLVRDAGAFTAFEEKTGTNSCARGALLLLMAALGEGEPGRVVARGSSVEREFDPDDPTGVSYIGIVFPGPSPGEGAEPKSP